MEALKPSATRLIEALADAHDSGQYVVVDGRYVPAATLERLINAEAPGDRHNAGKSIVVSLACQRLNPQSIYRLLVAAYPAPDFRDDIKGLVNWVCEQNALGKPCKLPARALNDTTTIVELSTKDFSEVAALEHDGILSTEKSLGHGRNGLLTLVGKVTPTAAKRAVRDLFDGPLPDVGPKDLIAASPAPLLADSHERLAQFFAALYPTTALAQSDQGTSPLINIVFRTFKTKDGRSAPFGGGLTLSAIHWAQSVKNHAWDKWCHMENGVLFRVNPVTGVEGKGAGSGKLGSYTDADITARGRMYVLVESDDLPLKVQMAFWWKHRDYVAALTSSGGKSLHALLVVAGFSLDIYRRAARTLTNYFRPFGFDATDNASRLSRLPGVERTSKAMGNDPFGLAGRQELLWLNPDAAFAYKLLPEHKKHESKKAKTPAGA